MGEKEEKKKRSKENKWKGWEGILWKFYPSCGSLTNGEGQPDSGHLAFKDGGKDPNPHLLYQRPTGGGMGSGAGQF